MNDKIMTASAIAPDGRTVYVADRPPNPGERGWWISAGAKIEDAVARIVISGMYADGGFGWVNPSIVGERSHERCLTVSYTEAHDPSIAVLAARIAGTFPVVVVHPHTVVGGL